MPAGAVYVGRPTRWGNPFAVTDIGTQVGPGARSWHRFLSAHALHAPLAVDLYAAWLQAQLQHNPAFLAPLRGHDLACWCPLDQPCHADVLLKAANA